MDFQLNTALDVRALRRFFLVGAFGLGSLKISSIDPEVVDGRGVVESAIVVRLSDDEDCKLFHWDSSFSTGNDFEGPSSRSASLPGFSG